MSKAHTIGPASVASPSAVALLDMPSKTQIAPCRLLYQDPDGRRYYSGFTGTTRDAWEGDIIDGNGEVQWFDPFPVDQLPMKGFFVGESVENTLWDTVPRSERPSFGRYPDRRIRTNVSPGSLWIVTPQAAAAEERRLIERWAVRASRTPAKRASIFRLMMASEPRDMLTVGVKMLLLDEDEGVLWVKRVLGVLQLSDGIPRTAADVRQVALEQLADLDEQTPAYPEPATLPF